MIRYDLRCANGHTFDGWFSDSGTYDRLRAVGQVSCSVCGSTEVEKALMAPAVAPARRARPDPGPETQPPAPPSPAPAPGGAMVAPGRAPGPDLAALRAKIEAVSDDVGRDFAAEARRIHAGEAPERPILGEATAREAKALVEDEIPVMPLPWWQRRDD